MGSSTERFTILRAQAGDREALEKLMILLEKPLYRYLVRLVGDPVSAEDILQDVLLVLWRKLVWLRDPEMLRPWAFRIASRTAFKWLRKHGKLNEESLDSAATAEAPEETAAVDPELLAHIERLSPASRAVIALHYLEDLSLKEISEILEIPLGTVKSRLGYGIVQLKARMGVSG